MPDETRPAASAGPPTTPTSPAEAMRLSDVPEKQLDQIGSDLGLTRDEFADKSAFIAAILDRRQLIGTLDRNVLLELLTWSGQSAPAGASREQITAEVIKNKSMRFASLSLPALVTLARLRGLEIDDTADVEQAISVLKSKEGFWDKLARKRRALVGKWVSKMIGDVGGINTAEPSASKDAAAKKPDASPREKPIDHEIEDSGLLAGLTSRVKRTADQYLNQKLDEIEARIDRKLDEIDQKLSQWRDKEIANRVRIFKISLWVTVAVGAATLLISYLSVYIPLMRMK
jgi:hypothetical protein